MEILGVIIGIISIAASWYFTRVYYLKSLEDQSKTFSSAAQDYRRIIEKLADNGSNDSVINRKLLEEKRIDQCVEKYTKTGGGDHLIKMIDTYTDLSNVEKADLLDTALLRARGRKAKANPYREKDGK